MSNRTEQNLTLSKKQQRALPIFLSARSVAEGCRRARISRTLFYEWMKDETFRTIYEEHQRELVQDSINSLKLMSMQAVEGLGRLLRARSESTRLKAILAVIEHSLTAIQNEHLELRITELEKQISEGREEV